MNPGLKFPNLNQTEPQLKTKQPINKIKFRTVDQLSVHLKTCSMKMKIEMNIRIMKRMKMRSLDKFWKLEKSKLLV